MSTKTDILLSLWCEARSRFTAQIEGIHSQDLLKRLDTAPNSVGFLIRHIGEVELLFAKNVFGESNIKVTAKTVIEKRDVGIWTDLESLKQYVLDSFQILKSVIAKQSDADWDSLTTTAEFGTKSKAEAFGRIISHTTYHAGQMALLLKYGKV